MLPFDYHTATTAVTVYGAVLMVAVFRLPVTQEKGDKKDKKHSCCCDSYAFASHKLNISFTIVTSQHYNTKRA